MDKTENGEGEGRVGDVARPQNFGVPYPVNRDLRIATSPTLVSAAALPRVSPASLFAILGADGDPVREG